MADKIDASLDLLRRLDPKLVTENVQSICSLLQLGEDGEELAQELLSSVDTPLIVARCKETNKEFLCCDYNRDGDLYRSPYSNKYNPPTNDDELPYPSPALRELEIKANESFDIYRDLYYDGGGMSSVYMWDTAEDLDASCIDEGFAGVVLFKKQTEDGAGKWDSIHVFEVTPEGSQATYKLTSAVILDLGSGSKDNELSLSGNMTRQFQTTQILSTEGESKEWAHLVNIGQLVEKSETTVRNLLQDVYFDKLKDIMLKDLRSLGSVLDKKADDLKQTELIKGLLGL